jgi:hypothetical protein
MSAHIDKYLPGALILAETLALNEHCLSGADATGPFGRSNSAYRILSSYSKKVAPKAYRKITTAAYEHYLDFIIKKKAHA